MKSSSSLLLLLHQRCAHPALVQVVLLVRRRMLGQGPASPLHHRCNVRRCGCTVDRSSSRGRARRELASEGIAKGCLRPTVPFLRAESPLAKAKATNKCAPSARGRELRSTAQRRGCGGEEVLTTEKLVPDAGCMSPTNNELTDAALLKSQELLKQFSSLDLDFDPDAKDDQGCEESMSEISFRSLSPRRSLPAKCSSPQDDDDGTVKVPREFMKMMADMWDEIRVLKASASHKPEDLTSSRLGTSSASTSEPRKSGCSVTSFPSTASIRSDSHSSRSSPRRDAYFPAPLPAPSTPRRFLKAATCLPTTLAAPKTILQCESAAMRPRTATSYFVPSSSAVQVCIPPMVPHTRMAVPHTRAASHTPPCRSISMVQTVTVTTSWTVS